MNDKIAGINDEQEIKKIIIVNEDGTEETIEKGMVAIYKEIDGKTGLTMRFHNLRKAEVFEIIYGISKLVK
jgi:hypothetical protein